MLLTNISVAEGRTGGSGVRRAPSVRHSGTGQLFCSLARSRSLVLGLLLEWEILNLSMSFLF